MFGIKVVDSTTHKTIATTTHHTMDRMMRDVWVMRRKYTGAIVEEYYCDPNKEDSKPVTTFRTFR